MGVAAMASRLARIAPTALRAQTRTFKTTAPAQGAVSTIGTLGICGILGSGLKYEIVQNAIPKNEHQVLAWIGGMFVFGNMARMGGSSEPAPTSGESDFDFDKFMADLEEK